MTKAKLLKVLTVLNACDAAKRWVKRSKATTATQLWNSCRNSTYMEWLVAELNYGPFSVPNLPHVYSHETPAAIRELVPAKDLVAALKQVPLK